MDTIKKEQINEKDEKIKQQNTLQLKCNMIEELQDERLRLLQQISILQESNRQLVRNKSIASTIDDTNIKDDDTNTNDTKTILKEESEKIIQNLQIKITKKEIEFNQEKKKRDELQNELQNRQKQYDEYINIHEERTSELNKQIQLYIQKDKENENKYTRLQSKISRVRQIILRNEHNFIHIPQLLSLVRAFKQHRYSSKHRRNSTVLGDLTDSQNCNSKCTVDSTALSSLPRTAIQIMNTMRLIRSGDNSNSSDSDSDIDTLS